jgi:hypothetical protein
MIINDVVRKGRPACGLEFRFRHLAGLFILMPVLFVRGPLGPQAPAPSPGISKSAADSCDAKVKRLEAYDTAGNFSIHQTTQFSEAEWNSYLAITLKPNYHPSLKELILKFDEGRLQAVATIDFNHLNFSSTQFLSGLIRSLLTGIHALTVRGSLLSDAGKASFQLEEARFDTITLPNLLVVEIISAVGRRQDPPFDPTQPNNLPYHIIKAEVHQGYVLIYQ